MTIPNDPDPDPFAQARQHACALAIALRVGDVSVTIVPAARLAHTLRRAAALLDTDRTPAQRAARRAEFHEATRDMHELLQRVPHSGATNPERHDAQKLVRWTVARSASPQELGGPHLFELDARGTSLCEVHFDRLHVVRCIFITNLHQAQFSHALIADSDFSYSGLRNTSWYETSLHQTCFRDACFTDATLVRTTFIDCDLRGSDFSVTDQGALAASTRTQGDVRFLRCDLRGTSWTGRDLSRVRAIDCKQQGLLGITESIPWYGSFAATRSLVS